MVNTLLLDEKIKISGFRKDYIVKELGISHAAFCNKVKGKSSFKLCEVKELCRILDIKDEDRAKIFCS